MKITGTKVETSWRHPLYKWRNRHSYVITPEPKLEVVTIVDYSAESTVFKIVVHDGNE